MRAEWLERCRHDSKLWHSSKKGYMFCFQVRGNLLVFPRVTCVGPTARITDRDAKGQRYSTMSSSGGRDSLSIKGRASTKIIITNKTNRKYIIHETNHWPMLSLPRKSCHLYRVDWDCHWSDDPRQLTEGRCTVGSVISDGSHVKGLGVTCL